MTQVSFSILYLMLAESLKESFFLAESESLLVATDQTFYTLYTISIRITVLM